MISVEALHKHNTGLWCNHEWCQLLEMWSICRMFSKLVSESIENNCFDVCLDSISQKRFPNWLPFPFSKEIKYFHMLFNRWSSRNFDLLLQMIFNLKRSIDLRWLFDPVLSSIHRWSCWNISIARGPVKVRSLIEGCKLCTHCNIGGICRYSGIAPLLFY